MKNNVVNTSSGIEKALSFQVKELRRKAVLTQEDLAKRTGVGLRFIRELEQGKKTVRLDKVNQVLALFGYHVAAVKDS